MINALFDTWLKKSPLQAASLPDDQKVFVAAGKSYPIDRILDRQNLHTQVKLSYNAGTWWLFNPHWDLSGEEAYDSDVQVRSVFKMSLFRTPKLINGMLSFYRGTNLEFEVVATSGAPGFQFKGAESVRGRGMLPPSSEWRINTRGYWLDTRGIEGMFYHITPDPYRGSGFVRSELGLHRDANVPGSAGCIVVRDSRIFNNRLVPFLAGLSQTQRQINLSVEYQ